MSINTFTWLTQHCSIEPLAIKPGFTLDEKEGVVRNHAKQLMEKILCDLQRQLDYERLQLQKM